MSVYRDPRDGTWRFRVRVRTPAGPLRLSGTPTTIGLSDTKVAAQEAERRAIAAAHAGPSLVSPTLLEFQPTFLEHADAQNEYSTTKAKRQILRDHIVPHFGPWHLDAITFAAIEDFKHTLVRPKTKGGKELSAKTGNNILTVLRKLFVVAKKRGKLAVVPEFEWLPMEPADFDFLDFADAEALIDAADEEWRCMIAIGIKCGLRQGELLELRWADVDLKGGKLWVRRSYVRGRVKLPKSRKPREVPLGNDALAALKEHRHLRGELVFCDADGNRLTNGECKHPLYRACAAAGIRRIGWHVLRHTFGSLLASQGVPLRTIQAYMGHADGKTTERYAHLSPTTAREAVKMLDRVAHPLAGGTRKRGSKHETA